MDLHRKMRRLLLPISLVLVFCCCVIGIAQMLREHRRTPRVLATYPVADEIGIAPDARMTLTFDASMMPTSIGPSTLLLRDDHERILPSTISYESSTHTAVVSSANALRSGSTYHVTLLGGPQGVRDARGHPLAADHVWSFTTGVPAVASITAGPGGPILLITAAENGFSQYYAEILRNEGFNEFTVIDVSRLSAALLERCTLVLLAEVPLDNRQIQLLSKWVRQGGDLISMRPSRELARVFEPNHSDATYGRSSLQDAYLAIEGSTPAGAGLTHEPLQFHGSAEEVAGSGATTLATLYKDATTATPFPAVSLLPFGAGKVVFFHYDLARSVVYTRQGNPLWSNQERDGVVPIRSDDLFYGGSSADPKPDWVDSRRIAVPQADEQQRLLSNIITLLSEAKKPLPHFWYLPRGLKAAVVLTGDDHGQGGTLSRFETYRKKSPVGCSVERWECIRATSNIFVGSISPANALAFARDGFEIGLHVYTECKDWPTQTTRQPDGRTTTQIDRPYADALYNRQLAAFHAMYTDIPAPVSNRIDCVTWGDYDTQPQVELSHGIRFDTNYYFWPAAWVRDQPGLFTGSGMPMRFAKLDGSPVDVYQAATQMTDESKQSYPKTIDTLLSNALGDREYFGVFTVNMHNDQRRSAGADAVIASALARHVPLLTAAQMLRWLDGRNGSSFGNLAWSEGQLGFTTAVGVGGDGLQVLLPLTSSAGTLVSLTRDGVEVQREIRSVAGLRYAAFPAASGRFVGTYRPLAESLR